MISWLTWVLFWRTGALSTLFNHGCVENEDPKTKTEDLRPCGLKRRPTGLKRRPTGLKRRPTGLKRRPTGLKRRPTGLKRRPTGLKRRPTGLKRRPTGLKRTPTSRSRICNIFLTITVSTFSSVSYSVHIAKSTLTEPPFNPGLLTCICDTFRGRSLLFLRIAGA